MCGVHQTLAEQGNPHADPNPMIKAYVLNPWRLTLALGTQP